VSGYDRAAAAFAFCGLLLVLNAWGVSRRLGETFRPSRKEAPWMYATTPTSTWGWRTFGMVLLLLGVCAVVLQDPS
jgi:hypothetical protein